MKKIYCIFMAASLLCSCEAFLDEKPQSDITRETTQTSEQVSAYATADDAQLELNGAYASLKSDMYEGILFYIGECMSDNCYIGGDGISEEQLGNMSVTAVNSAVSLLWAQYYRALGTATSVIENVKLMPADAISQADRSRITAEAKFLRAWLLFDIVRYWGAAPLSLALIPSITTENIDEWYPIMYPERTPAEDIYRQILDDLSDDAIACLVSKSNGDPQATKGAAYGLLAKVYATMGEKSGRDYQKVVDYCDKVIGEGYTLVPNFDDLWTVSGKLSSEGIFELYFSDAAEAHNWAYWVLLTDKSGSVEVSWRRYCCPSHDIVAKFDKAKDKRYASSIYWAKVPYDTYYPANNYPLAYKIRQKESDIILLRLADILLLKAEALVELGRSADAIALVNQVRNRAGVDPLPGNMSVDKARLAVENERQLELFLEGHRWFDLLRNDRMEEVMLQSHDKNGNLQFTDIPSWRRLLPVPQDQIDINERLTQNEGY